MKERSAGGVIINNGCAAIVTQQQHTFSLPKGHINKDESVLDAAYREIYEETGLSRGDLKYISKLETYTRPDGVTGNPKDIHMFLFTTKKQELEPIDKTNPEAKWIEIDKVVNHLTYKEDKAFFQRYIRKFKLY